jgi:hypothetical protein
VVLVVAVMVVKAQLRLTQPLVQQILVAVVVVPEMTIVRSVVLVVRVL